MSGLGLAFHGFLKHRLLLVKDLSRRHHGEKRGPGTRRGIASFMFQRSVHQLDCVLVT